LRISEMRVDKAFLFRLDRVHRRRCRLDVGVRGARAAVIRPIATPRTIGDARLVRPGRIILLQRSGARQLRDAFGRDLREGELHRLDASLRPLAGGEQLRDPGESALAALDFVRCRPVGEAQGLCYFGRGR
jgi:hypothetical protein